MVSIEYEWLNQHKEICFQYRGEYIAVVGTQIVAHDRDLRNLVAKTSSLSVIPHISRIPDTVENEIPSNIPIPESNLF